MNERKLWMVWIGLALAVAAAFGLWTGSDVEPGIVAAAQEHPDSGSQAPVLLSSEEAEPHLRVVDSAPDAPPEVMPDDDELIAALRALGSLDEYTSGDVPAIEARVNELTMAVITPIGRLQRAIELLTNGRLTEDPTLASAPERGALRGLVFGSLMHRHGQRPGSKLRAGNPEPVVALALEGAPTWTEAVRGRLLHLAEAFSTEKGRFLTERHIRHVVELRALHPDIGPFYSTLLGYILKDMPKVDQHLLLDILQGDQEDPILVRLALEQLFGQGKDQLAMGLARAFLTGQDTPLPLRSAVLRAVASAAPMDMALDCSQEFSKGGELGLALTLSYRAGGHEAVLERYSALVVAGSEPEFRRLLISGVSDSSVLLGVAETDPEPKVRGQALITASGLREFNSQGECLDLLESSLGLPPDDPTGLPPHYTAMAVTNITRRNMASSDPLFKRSIRLLEDLLERGTLDERAKSRVHAELDRLGISH